MRDRLCEYCAFSKTCTLKENDECMQHKMIVNIYIQGATDQRKIDIEKACNAYTAELKEIINIFNKVGEMRGIEELGEILSFDECIRDFRKKVEA